MTAAKATELRQQSVRDLERANRARHQPFADAYRKRIAFLDRIIVEAERREDRETSR